MMETNGMAREPVGRKEPCPCGSGKKYKNCCFKKGIEYERDEAGTVSRLVQLDDEQKKIIEEQRKKFVEKFGREPGPHDEIFFDMPPAEHLEAILAEAMKQTGVDPAAIYAFEKTGFMLSRENQHLMSDGDLAEWDAAVDEYHRLHGEPGKD
jgi:hypothetical protein